MANRHERATYRCAECGWQTSKWVGRCGECQAWGSVAEQATGPAPARVTAGPVSAAAVPIVDVPAAHARHRPTTVPELDRVLGGGLVEGAAVLLAGEPGVGKSTLLLEVAAAAARLGTSVLYVTGEESAAQVRLRAERVDAVARGLYLAAETDLGAVLSHVDKVGPGLLVVDSVQTVASADTEGAAGGVGQVRTVTAALVRVAKERGIPTVLVGHVTKEGSVAGPKVTEHLVDVVLSFEGDRHTRLRMVRAVKNRYGPTDEVGCFDLGGGGIASLPDPSGLFLSSRARSVPGTCVTVTLEGRRPLVAEVQALVSEGPPNGAPRRTTSGLDGNRLHLILAVLQRRVRLAVGASDVFAATVGGVRLREPAADLALAAALASASVDQPVSPGIVAIGEVGLAGDVRRVPDIRQRLAEASRLGFTCAIVPSDPGEAPAGMTVVEVADIESGLRAAGMNIDERSRRASGYPDTGRGGSYGRRYQSARRRSTMGKKSANRPVHLRPISP